MDKLQQTIGYHFRSPRLLETALTHSSYANEHRKAGVEYNERLEFLGDSVLGMIAAEHLFRNELNMPEGKMSRYRAELVCERSLAAVADEVGLGRLLRLGRGEESGGGRERPSIKADAVEAVIAAIYLDGGMEPAVRFVKRFVLSRMREAEQENRDWKTELQEILQREGPTGIEYVLEGESGPDHDKRFVMSVRWNGKTVGTGEGKSKKLAEQRAARAAMEHMDR
ncbi:MAG: ribonuclease III [Oscillospiraceae bacterium]|nr:ribonuclease III [Oscillospiraceae bacterium]